MRSLLFICSVVLLLPTASFADVIYRLDGRKLVGKIVKEEPKRIQFAVTRGKMKMNIWILRIDIDRIERGDLPDAEFAKRRAALGPADVRGFERLIAWAERKNLPNQASHLKRELPEVHRQKRKLDFPRSWCRGCDSQGKRACTQCEGKGKLLDPCQRCKGEGTILCRVCAHKETPGLLRCRKCSGAGEIERFDVKKGRKLKVKCPDCRGKGTKVCPECSGKLKQKCPLCKGVKGIFSDCVSCEGKPLQLCVTCNGSGVQAKQLTLEEYEKEEAERKAREAEEKKKAEEEAKKKAAEDGEQIGGSPGDKKPDPKKPGEKMKDDKNSGVNPKREG